MSAENLKIVSLCDLDSDCRVSRDDVEDAAREALAFIEELQEEVSRLSKGQREYGFELDWSKAPDWAEWFAVDADMSAFWYKHKPKTATASWIFSEETMTPGINYARFTGMVITTKDWKKALWKRP